LESEINAITGLIPYDYGQITRVGRSKGFAPPREIDSGGVVPLCGPFGVDNRGNYPGSVGKRSLRPWGEKCFFRTGFLMGIPDRYSLEAR
jgi:hypothetical protein